MANKFYQFDYAEMNGFEITNMGILNIQCNREVSREFLKEHAREHLKSPHANIIISNVTKLTKAEFESITGQKTA